MDKKLLNVLIAGAVIMGVFVSSPCNADSPRQDLGETHYSEKCSDGVLGWYEWESWDVQKEDQVRGVLDLCKHGADGTPSCKQIAKQNNYIYPQCQRLSPNHGYSAKIACCLKERNSSQRLDLMR